MTPKKTLPKTLASSPPPVTMTDDQAAQCDAQLPFSSAPTGLKTAAEPTNPVTGTAGCAIPQDNTAAAHGLTQIQTRSRSQQSPASTFAALPENLSQESGSSTAALAGDQETLHEEKPLFQPAPSTTRAADGPANPDTGNVGFPITRHYTMAPPSPSKILNYATEKAKSSTSDSKSSKRRVNIADTVEICDEGTRNEPDVEDVDAINPNDTVLSNNLHSQNHPASLTKMLSGSGRKTGTSAGQKPSKVQVNMARLLDANLKYTVARHDRHAHGALVDRGANGGIAGDDTCIIERTQQRVDLSGIDNHEMCDIPIASVGAHVRTQNGPVIAVMHNYAVVPGHKTIYSSVHTKI